MPPAYLGEFEQQVLLVVLRLGDDAFGPAIGVELERRAGRRVSRGALYTTFDRLDDKGLLRWRTVPGTEARDGLPRRLYTVTAAGLAALRAARDVVRNLWDGLDFLFPGASPPDPLHALSRGPRAPLRSRGSFAALTRARLRKGRVR
jgi:DNA-binding PadR family transcriptional regulator